MLCQEQRVRARAGGPSPTRLTPKHDGYSHKNLWVQQSAGKWSSPLERCAVTPFPVPKLYPEGSPRATLGSSSHPGGTRKRFAGSGANSCALKKVVKRLPSARSLEEKGLFLHYCFHEGNSDFPAICNDSVAPRVPPRREGIPWLFHPKSLCLSSAHSPGKSFA